MSTLILIFICSFLAFSISAICGGGAGLILIPILGRLLPVTQVPAALSIGTFTSSVSRIIVFKKNIYWHIVKYFVLASLPAVWLGAWLLKFLNPAYLEIVMGLFLVSNLPFIFKKPKELAETKRPKTVVLMTIGFLAGFLSGLTGAVGLLFNKFYLRYGLTKEEIVATRAANELLLHLVKIILYTLFGLLSVNVISTGIVVAVAAVLSAWSMKWILPRLSEFVFKKIGYLAMVTSGAIMLTHAGTNLLTANSGDLFTSYKEEGFETDFKWRNETYELEFKWDDGFEFEQVVPITELSAEQQQLVMSHKQDADIIIIEAVYEIGEKGYEASFYKNNKFVGKINVE